MPQNSDKATSFRGSEKTVKAVTFNPSAKRYLTMNVLDYFSIGKRLRMTVIALSFVAVAGLLVFGIIWRSGGPAADGVFLYDNEDVVRFLGQRQISIGYYFRMRRNTEGNKLYISPYSDDPTARRLITISENGVESRTAPGKTVYLNDATEFVAWTDDFTQGVEFEGGYRLKLPQFASFDIDPSGEYFVIGEKHSTWLGRVGSPQDRVLISEELSASKVFIQRGRILVCGFVFKGGGVKQTASCLTLRKKPDGYEIEQKIDFPWAGGVVDVDPRSDRLLLQGWSDIFTREHICDIRTKTRKSIGWAKNWGFFLTNNLLNAKTPGMNKAERKRIPDEKH